MQIIVNSRKKFSRNGYMKHQNNVRKIREGKVDEQDGTGSAGWGLRCNY